MTNYKYFTDYKKSFNLESDSNNTVYQTNKTLFENEEKLTEEPKCFHGFYKSTCRICYIMESIEAARPAMLEYKQAIINLKNPRYFRGTGQVKESDVCRQHYDFKPNFDYYRACESLAIRYWIATIRFRRNIKLSYGISFDRGTKGYLLDKKAIDELILRSNNTLLKPHYKEILSAAQQNNHECVFSNAHIAMMPQSTTETHYSRKQEKTIATTKVNFTILDDTQPPLM